MEGENRRGGRGEGRGRGGDRGRGGRGGRGGDRGRGGRGGRGGKGGRGGPQEQEWIPFTKLGRLVKAGKIKTIEEIYLHSLPVKEHQIIDHFFKDTLKDEVMKISSVQKQTRAGQRTRFKAFVILGDCNGHCGLGVKCAKEVATAIRGALILAKLSLVPIRRGYWGEMLGKVHTVPCKVTGKCGSVRVRLIPAPKGSGVVASPVPAKLLHFAGIEDVYTNSAGHTKTLGNFIKATFYALKKTYGFLTPDLWNQEDIPMSLYQQHTDFLMVSGKKSQFEK